MASVRNRLEEVSSTDDDESSSIQAYTTFASLGTEDSAEQGTRSNTDINGDVGDYQRTDSGVEDTSVLSEKFKSRCCKFVDVTITVVVIFLIWMALSLPTAFYIRTEVEHTPNSPATNCTAYNARSNNMCTGYLQQYSKCLQDNSTSDDDDIYVTANDEAGLRAIFQFIRNLSLESRSVPDNEDLQQCVTSLESLICLYFIPLCYNGNTSVRPSMKQCRRTQNVCEQFVPPQALQAFSPKCIADSPLDRINCNVQATPFIGYNNATKCSEGFYRTVNETCLPECGVWSPYSKRTVLITDIIAIFSTVVAIIFGVAVVVFSCLRWQKMFRYPSIFVVYQTIPTVLLAVLVLVGFAARKQLFCQSRNLKESFEHPSRFCILTGIVFYYVVMQLLFWWLWHTVAVFWSVAWPFHARKFNTSRNTKYLHITFALASLLLPVASPFVVWLVHNTSKGSQLVTTSGFTITRSPPFLCAGYDTRVNFWAFIFPISVTLAIGVTLLVLILRIVITKHFLSKIYKIRVNLNWALELRVLIVLGYYVLIGTAVLTIFTLALATLEDLIDRLAALIECEYNGIPFNTSDPYCTDEMEELMQFDDPYPSIIAIVFLGLLPAVNLVYVIKVKEIVKKFKCCQTRQVQYVPKESSRSSRYVPYKEPISTTLRHGSLIIHKKTAHTEPLISSQSNNDLRQ